MANKSSNDGLSELERLSQQMKKSADESAQREKQKDIQRKKTRDVLSEFRSFSISMAARELQPVATPELIAQVNTLNNEPETARLRELINGLASDLEQRTSRLARTNPDTESINQSMKTLAILVRLFFSLNT